MSTRPPETETERETGREREREAEREAETGRESEPARADPPELVAYAEHQRRRGLARETIRSRGYVLRPLAAWLSEERHKALGEASPDDLRRFLARPRREIAPATHFSNIATIKAFYAALVELERIESDPASTLRSRRLVSPRRPISLPRVRAILLEASRVQGPEAPRAAAVALRDRACLELLFATGMRLAEVASARVVDVDPGDASVLVRRAKRGVSRRLPLPPSAVEALQRYLDEGRPLLVAGGRDDEGRLLLGVGGRPLGRDGIYERVRRVSARCGARTHPHAFRRTLATELARAGVSLPVIQDVLGHAHLSMTSSYVQVGVPEMRGALDALDRTRPESHRVRPGRAVQKQLFAGWAFGGVTDSPFRSSPTQPEMAAQSWMALGRQVEEA